MQGPPPGNVKVTVLNAPAEQLESQLNEWIRKNKARVMGSSQSSASHNGQVLVTMVIWHQ